MEPPLELVMLTIIDAASGSLSSSAASSVADDIRAGDVEFVIDLVEAAVADQHEDDGIVGLGLLCNFAKLRFDVGAWWLRGRRAF